MTKLSRLVDPYNCGANNNNNTNISSRKYNCHDALNVVICHINYIQILELACGNGSIIHIHQCSNKKCKFIKDLPPTDNFLGSVTRLICFCIILSRKTYVDCHSVNSIFFIYLFIYLVSYLFILITCKWC